MGAAADKQGVGALAKELTDARGRGLGRLDRRVGRKGPLALPLLTELAQVHAADSPGLDRGPAIRRLLADALKAWEATAGQQEAAALVRALFGLDRATALPTPKTLLSEARKTWKTEDADAFHDIQHEDFRLFAAFLLEFVPQQQSEAPATAASKGETAEAVVPPVHAVDAPRPAPGAPVEPPEATTAAERSGRQPQS